MRKVGRTFHIVGRHQKSKKQQSKRNLCMQMRNKLAFHHTKPSRRIYQIEYSLDYIMWACAMDGPWITCQRPRPLPETDIIDNMSHFYQWSAKFSIQLILNELFMVLITVMTLKLNAKAFLAKSDEAYTHTSQSRDPRH